MSDDGLRALREVRFDWALMEEDVWAPSPFHVDGLHEVAKRQVGGGIDAAERSAGSNPIGVVVEGDKGTGKTHLLGWAREEVQARGGYFFLVGVHEGSSFWHNVLIGVVNGLLRPMRPAGGDQQLRVLLRRLAERVGVPADVAAAVAGDASLTPSELDTFGAALQRRDGLVGRQCQDVVRALALYASDDARASLVGDSFLHGIDDDDESAQRSLWGLRRTSKSAELTVRDIFQLLALTGPSVVAVDQIDGLLAASLNPTRRAGSTEGDEAAARLLDDVATGLMGLHNAARRSLTVVACLASSWAAIKAKGFASAPSRFRQEVRLGPLPSPAVAAELVARRLGAIYTADGFTPPHPTWPVAPGAFAEAPEYTPRALLMRIDAHIQACLADDAVTELTHLGTGAAGGPGARGGAGGPGAAALGGGATGPGGLAGAGGAGVRRRPRATAGELGALDERYAELRRRADVTAAFDPRTEDDVMPGLLRAGLEAWIIEQGPNAAAFTLDPPPGPKPALHARLRRVLDEAIEYEAHWSFRAIVADHPIAALNRFRTAQTASGLLDGSGGRHLTLLRNQDWSAGRQTQQTLDGFRRAGGDDRPVSAEDLRTFSTLAAMLREGDPRLAEWLVDRQPASSTELFEEVLAKATVGLPGAEPAPEPAAVPAHAEAVAAPEVDRIPAAEPVPEAATRGAVIAPLPEATAGGATVADRAPAIRRPSPGAVEPPLPFAPPAPARPAPSPAPPATPAPVDMHVAPGAASSSTRRPVAPDPAIVAPRPDQAPAPTAAAPPGHIVLGVTAADGVPVPVALRDLTKHAVIFAGSGSGKTVLIRRLVEDCALAGVSSIVLDPNNDLARLGDPWPEPPAGWAAGDAGRAEEYLATTDVVVWTPGRAGGRPLTFQPLPDFGPVLDDPDEFTQAVEAALASLAPRAQAEGGSTRALQQRAVLRQALEAFGRRGGGSLAAFLQMLADLPPGISDLDDAPKVAGALAQTLRAVRIVDPLFGGIGQAADPGVLLTPPPGKRARVSVVNFVGLADEAARQGFVNQLQMALFAWLKRHPHPSLGGLLVMDEAQTLAPSGAMTPCTQSSIVLASQARKYGLGLVFATQAVTGLHNRIASNAATQVLGRMNAPAQITAARGLAQAKGGDVPDIARLGHGHFYVAREGRRYEKVSTAMCLSHHPPNPLTAEDVLARAAAGPTG